MKASHSLMLLKFLVKLYYEVLLNLILAAFGPKELFQTEQK
jgi:hypothetical protein